ncbi:uncharacterized protein G2W53_013701 [Senna tora]|uniref:Uncharacterized protein n=1 Tax=Senna tora TaxID=362788 RepID=A0A834TZ87_9FABA|nr:uncharacterized protein G2W53_013701 [Senna tora]
MHYISMKRFLPPSSFETQPLISLWNFLFQSRTISEIAVRSNRSLRTVLVRVAVHAKRSGG